MRAFDPNTHHRSIDKATIIRLRDGLGGYLAGITGRAGPSATGFSGLAIGLDEITMEPGTRFSLHEHEGDHILYVLEGRGAIAIGGSVYSLAAGDSVYVPAECPHGVTTVSEADERFRFLAFGLPHRPLDDDGRMQIVEPDVDGTTRT
jgi:quercetin dioxygenase-like cupin family protein